jgi:hypothetical protein
VIGGGRPGGARQRQAGQALLLLLALLGALLLAVLTLVDSGQLAVQRMRLAAAADAAALSAAATEARALNFAASMNRAVVANEAAIAQSVTLRAWSQYMHTNLRNVDTLTRWLPYLGPVTTTLERFWGGYDRVLQPSLVAAEAAFAISIPALAAAQTLLLEGSGLAAADAARRTLRANVPDARLSTGGDWLLAQSVAESQRFTERRSGPRRDRQRAVIVASLDPFVRGRNRRITPPVAGLVVRFERRGGTELRGFEQWRAVDTLSLHARGGLLGGWRERVPIGWGAALQGRAAVASAASPRTAHGGSARVNPRATRLAEARLLPRATHRGVASLHELRELAPRSVPARRWSVRIMQPRPALRLSDRLLGVRSITATSGERVGIAPDLAGDALFASSAATVRYVRQERRRDGRTELASLYAPYWRARLAPIAGADAAIARAIDRTPDPLPGIAP